MDIRMKFIASILLLCSINAVACAPKPIRFATLEFFPTPMFGSAFKTNEKTGKVRGKFWISKGGMVEKFEIVEVTPKELPIEPIEKAIRKSRFSMSSNFAVIAQEIEITFDIDLRGTVELEMPKVEAIEVELVNYNDPK
jgi:hypothetical protein